jgi:hypothetical protein
MLLTIEKTIIISGAIASSICLFSTALNNINNIQIHSNKISDINYNRMIITNGVTMIFSGLAFGYFTFVAIK